jgi:hypothetical protein
MKRIFTVMLLAAAVGGCVVVPPGRGYYGDRHSRGQDYNQGYGHHRGSDHDHRDRQWGYDGDYDHGR